MIVTFSGASGVGKTTIYRALLSQLPNSRMLVSYTNRERRNSDVKGEYRYGKLLLQIFNRLGLFIWVADIHGNKYATLKRSVRKGLKNYDEIYLMNISPDKVRQLRVYARELSSEEFIISFYISASRFVLRKRLEGRGDSEFEIRKRIRDCEKWDLEAEKSDIPFIFIDNDSDPIFAVEEVLERIYEKRKS